MASVHDNQSAATSEVNMTIDPAHMNLLDEYNTGDNPHSGRTLRDHLIGTHDLIREWGNPGHVASGALFHSIYGTQAYRVSSADLQCRPHIASVIGEQAEELAYLFCVSDRVGLFFEADKPNPRLWDYRRSELVPVAPQAVAELIEIEIANYVEQIEPSRPLAERQISRRNQMFARGEPYMSAGAKKAFQDMQARTVIAR
ncbi:MAG: hypothetical protein O7F71_15635 [Gammaproteobacteria bacterium]|nr:hypothetical protein [Gammaproteobacteria bacterium]